LPILAPMRGIAVTASEIRKQNTRSNRLAMWIAGLAMAAALVGLAFTRPGGLSFIFE